MKARLLRICTVSISFRLLLKGQLKYMSKYFDTYASSAPGEELFELEELENTVPYPIPIERKPTPWKDWRSLIALYCLFQKIKPTIVHTHTPKAGLLGMMASYFAKVPIRLHTVAGIPWMESSGIIRWALKWMERFTYRFATHVYSNSFAMRDFILESKLIRPNKISVIGQGSSNGIDTNWYHKTVEVEELAIQLRNQFNLEGYKVLLFVGRLVKDKGIEELLEAYKALKKKYKIKLLLVGPFEKDRDPLSSQAMYTIENDPGIITTGYVKDVRQYMAVSYLLAFPSYREGFPNVPMQAGAMGLPSVVTDINGCNEIIQNGVNGLFIQPKNIPSLQSALESLLSDQDLYKKIASNARPMITSRFEQEHIWELIFQEYNRHLKINGLINV